MTTETINSRERENTSDCEEQIGDAARSGERESVCEVRDIFEGGVQDLYIYCRVRVV